MSIEELNPQVRSEFVGYTHCFKRFFEINGHRYDRWETVRANGILSPSEAKRRRIPYKKNILIEMVGVDDYDDYIFLFPIRKNGHLPGGIGDVTIVLENNLPVYTPSDLYTKYNGCWAQMTFIQGGEVYAYKQIDLGYFREIKGIS